MGLSDCGGGIGLRLEYSFLLARPSPAIDGRAGRIRVALKFV